MTGGQHPDVLIDRLRTRAADPERRTDARPSQFSASSRTLDLGALVSMAGGLAADLGGVVEANRSGRVDAAGAARAKTLGAQMTTPAPSVLPGPADAATIAAAEASLGATLPPFMRRVYAEVADGGFGPGSGLLPLASVAAAYRELRAPDGPLPRGRAWPDGLLPVVDADGGFDCVDASSGRVVGWDPGGLTEHAGDAASRRSFRDLSPSLEAWLSAWIGSKTDAERAADQVADVLSEDNMVRMAREARASIAKLSPQERAKMGLPEVGWERVVWGGLGWDDASPDAGPA